MAKRIDRGTSPSGLFGSEDGKLFCYPFVVTERNVGPVDHPIRNVFFAIVFISFSFLFLNGIIFV